MQVFQRIAKPFRVALRKESVDRNLFAGGVVGIIGVALRKESVDRNVSYITIVLGYLVALRKESVDRNLITKTTVIIRIRRSPQGERG